MKTPLNRSKQKGTALVVSMIILLVMSLIILQGARSANLELLIGNNAQHSAEALMRAEDSAIAGETVIEVNFPGAPTTDFGSMGSLGVYLDQTVNVASVNWTELNPAKSGSGENYREYIVEYLGPSAATGGSLSVGAGASSDTRYLYQVSGRGESSRGGARVVQTIYATVE